MASDTSLFKRAAFAVGTFSAFGTAAYYAYYGGSVESPPSIPVDAAPAPVPQPETAPTPQLSYRGTNVAGAEFDYRQLPGVENSNYVWVSHKDIDYLLSKNVRFVRLLFSWELLQPTLYGELDQKYGSTLYERVSYATSKGMRVMIEPHGGALQNFARYKGNTIGSSAVPNSAYADLWRRVSLAYLSFGSSVVFGLCNEPTNISTVQWYSGAQAAVDAVRSTGNNTLIMVPGNGYTSAYTWNDSWYDTAPVKVSNAVGWLKMRDPANNMVASVHLYLDPDGSGSTTNIVSPIIGSQRLSVVTNWARANGIKVHLSEIAASEANANGRAAIVDTLNYVNANSDVIIGWAWWTYGPPSWWGSYKFTLCPSSNYTVDNPKMAWLQPFLPQPAPTPVPADRDGDGIADSVDACPDVKGVTSSDPSKNGCPPPPPDRDGDGIIDANDACPDVKGIASTTVSKNGCPPSPTFVVTNKKTYDWNYGFCQEFYLKNASAVPISWTSAVIDLKTSWLRGSGATWGAVFPHLYASGVVTIKPAYGPTVQPGTTLTIGLCADRGADRTVVATLQSVAY